MRPALWIPWLALGCAPDLRGDRADTDAPDGPTVDVTEEDGSIRTTIDGTDHDVWVQWSPSDGAGAADWLLAFRRFRIALNGGVSGEGGAEAAPIEAPFEQVTELPEDGWRVDRPDEDDDGEPDYALGDWYDYDPVSHALTPRQVVYVVRMPGQTPVKLQVESYYDDVGTPGSLTVRWALLGDR